MTEKATIKSIARDLGISHMTVSRALSDNPNVRKDTRDAVLKRARELGYVKSAAAKAMRGDGTRIVGLLLPNITNEFYARFANALAKACEEQSLHLIIHLTDDNIIQERQSLDRLREIQAMAVIMVPAPGGEGTETVSGMKVVQLIRQRTIEDRAAAILIDDHEAICAAVRHLADEGHQSIGYIGGGQDLSSGRQRLTAYRDGLRRAGISENADLVLTGVPSFDMGRKCAEQLLDGGQATALICGGVEISNGALSALMDRGQQPGKDFAFIGYGDPAYYSWIGGGVSTVQLPVELLAEQAIKVLDDASNTSKDQPEDIRRFEANLAIR